MLPAPKLSPSSQTNTLNPSQIKPTKITIPITTIVVVDIFSISNMVLYLY